MSRGWLFNTTPDLGSGRFLVSATGYGLDGVNVDITVLRGAVTQVQSFSSADPFGDSTAVLTFPNITMFDDPSSTELRRWLRFFADIDIYWSPSVPADQNTAVEDLVIDPFTQQQTVTNPFTGPGVVKIWEGFIASLEFTDEGLSVQCQGALFQVDRYLAKPFFPSRPWPVEALIADQFDHTRRPNLRTKPLQTIWPASWSRRVPPYRGDQPAVYAPVVSPGANWTEYVSRNTGGWDASLTSFIQDLLTAMITRTGDGSAVVPGDAWTIRKVPGRQPQLYIRARNRPSDLTVWLGTPGVSVSLSSDSTQAGNMIFGNGTDLHGQVWNNSVMSVDGSRTDYMPLAADRSVYPLTENPLLVPGAFVTEVQAKFDGGFSQDDAISVSSLMLARDRDTGYTGSVTISSDPSPTMSRWTITAGMTLTLMGFLGSGAHGLRLHISAVAAAPEQGTVELTVDSRYRDLLTVQEAIARTRDPLTPVKMLQVNRQSVQVPDAQAPWSDAAGAGYVPQTSNGFHKSRPATMLFPYQGFTRLRPPISHPEYYVRCTANATVDDGRWAGPIPIRLSQSGTIVRTEFCVYDKWGNVLTDCPYHVSIYSLDVNSQYMPIAADGEGPDPFLDNAFESNDPTTGQPWPPNSGMGPDPSLIIGWGNTSNNISNPAGFSPGSQADGNGPTGLLIDQVSWQYDCSAANPQYDPSLPAGQEPNDALLVWAMFYAKYQTAVYFMGRLFHQPVGSDS
jgi:hypothetical protein